MTELLKTTLNGLRSVGILPTFNRAKSYARQHIKFYLSSNKFGLIETKENIAETLELAFDSFNLVLDPRQKRQEIEGLINELLYLNPKTVLEIGTDKGGNLFLLSKLAREDASIFSIDLPGGKWGGGYSSWRIPLYKRFSILDQSIILLRRDSHLESTYTEIKSRLKNGVDLLFIDGDHSYDGVKKDFEKYNRLVNSGGVICFHDIVFNYLDESMEVYRFWQEIKANYRHKEFISDETNTGMGIGLIWID